MRFLINNTDLNFYFLFFIITFFFFLFIQIFFLLKNKSKLFFFIFNLIFIFFWLSISIFLYLNFFFSNFQIHLWNSFIFTKQFLFIQIFFFFFFFFIEIYSFFWSKKTINLEYSILFYINFFSWYCVLISSNFILFFVSLEVANLSFCLILALNKKLFSFRSAIKYFIINSMCSIFLLLSILIIYVIYGSLDFFHIFMMNLNHLLPLQLWALQGAFFFFFLSFFIKLGFFPFSSWILDIYEFSNWKTILYFLSIPKLSIFFFFYRFLYEIFIFKLASFLNIIILFLTINILILSFMLTIQINFKRFLGLSSIITSSLICICIFSTNTFSTTISFFYLFFYLFSIFSIIFLLKIETYIYGSDIIYFNIFKYSLSFFMLYKYLYIIFFLSLAGIPPFLGFFIKFYLFNFLYLSGYHNIIIILLVSSVFYSFAYIQFIRWILVSEPKKKKYRVFVLTPNCFSKEADLIWWGPFNKEEWRRRLNCIDLKIWNIKYKLYKYIIFLILIFLNFNLFFGFFFLDFFYFFIF